MKVNSLARLQTTFELKDNGESNSPNREKINCFLSQPNILKHDTKSIKIICMIGSNLGIN